MVLNAHLNLEGLTWSVLRQRILNNAYALGRKALLSNIKICVLRRGSDMLYHITEEFANFPNELRYTMTFQCVNFECCVL